jgi:hypothetical protein
VSSSSDSDYDSEGEKDNSDVEQENANTQNIVSPYVKDEKKNRRQSQKVKKDCVQISLFGN